MKYVKACLPNGKLLGTTICLMSILFIEIGISY